MGLPFHKLKRLWLLYLFLLFFAFFMFAISINVYVQSLQSAETQRQRIGEQPRRRSRTTPKNVVVAHYIGRGDIFSNLTEEEYNINKFHPIDGEGAEGRPVIISARDTFRMQRYFKLNSFNVLASDRIPLNRTLKDYRIKECRTKEYPRDLPSASVIIVFHNEAWSVLLRTITSVINRTPHALLKELILVDDASTRSYLKRPLEVFLQTLHLKQPPLLLRTKTRGGLVPARLLGASQASGDVLTFLDAHCECSQGWLEPLLARIQEQRNTVVCPVIDIISDDNFSYTKTFENHWGAFNWQLSYRWFATLRNEEDEEQQRHLKVADVTRPVSSPAMAGGLFAIDRKYFYEMGAYDKEMKIWGGENVEMSFRIWQCGGRVEISPCSHVGHVFRSRTPYTFPGGMSEVLAANLVRAAMVWMDDWQYLVLLYTAGMSLATRENVNVSERLELRKSLQCQPFSWYLQHVWPEHFFPAPDRFFGKIIWLDGESECAQAYSAHMRNIPGRLMSRDWPKIINQINQNNNAEKFMILLDVDRDKCLRPLEASAARTTMQPVTVGDCNAHPNTMDVFVITPQGQIKTNDNICLTYNEPAHRIRPTSTQRTASNVQLTQCYPDQRQRWKYDMSTQQLLHYETELCLTIRATPSVSQEKSTKIVLAIECDFKDITQKWGLIPLPWRL